MLATSKGEGGVFDSLNQQRYQKRPFLRRNVSISLKFLTMGSTFSSIKEVAVGARSRDELVTSDDEDDEDARPPKRRRVSHFSDSSLAARKENNSISRNPLGHVTNESIRRSRINGKPAAVDPSDFYGKSKPTTHFVSEVRRPQTSTKPSKKAIDDILAPFPVDFKRSLRVDVIGITPIEEDDEESLFLARNRKNPVDIKCKCSAAIFYAKNDEDPSVNIQPKDYVELCRSRKTCFLRITVGQDGRIKRELSLLEPFIFSGEEFYVQRKRFSTDRLSGQERTKHISDFADKYNVQVTLEPVGDQDNWPPLELPPVEDLISLGDGFEDSLPISKALHEGRATNNDLHLLCKTALLINPEQQCKTVPLGIWYEKLKQSVPYALRLQIRWALPSNLTALPTPPPKFESPRRKAAKPAVSDIPASPLTNKLDEAPDSPADSRAQRRRANVPTYNLKALSTIAQGKSPRVRKSRDPRSKPDQDLLDPSQAITVTYQFGRAESAENGIMRETTIVGLGCPFCQCRNRSVDDLKFHLISEHSNYRFGVRRQNPTRVTYFVEVVKSRASLSSAYDRARTFQLGKPLTLFDLEKYLNGDDSWTKAREGPLHNVWPEHLTDRAHDSSISSSPHESRHSSPNTSNDTDDLMDLDGDEVKLPTRPRKVFYVPKTSKPLYDTITKQILEPGDQIPNSDDEREESWFNQKHRDIINDYADITAEEKDYINQWNPFIVNEHLTSDKYLSQAVIRFVELNKSWFAKRKSRKAQFGKQMETFILRGAVSEKDFQKCCAIIRTAEKAKSRAEEEDVDMDKEAEEVPPTSPSKNRGLLDCVCCENTQPPDRVVCRGPVSFLPVM
jgi:hypothetical protein